MSIVQTQFFEWDDETMSVLVDDIDHQHQELLEIVNRLHQSIMKRTSREEGPEILQHLEMYTVAHFATEESLMRIFEYPDYPAHKAQHERLVNELKVVMVKLAEGATTLTAICCFT